MIIFYKKAFFLLCCSTAFVLSSPAQLNIEVAQCEKKINPVGVPLSEIHFNWQMNPNKKNQVQKAYQLVVAAKREELFSGKYTIWNSGTVKSCQSIFVTYTGNKLKPGQKYYWRVRVWDKNNKASVWCKPNYFITAFVEAKDWNGAKWIGYEELPDSMKVAPGAETHLLLEIN